MEFSVSDQRTFHIFPEVRTPAEFERVAARAAPLKKHGRVEIMVASLAEPTRADMPPGGSPWHEYAACLPTWQKFFPHEQMQPFLDMKHVARNRALLADCVKITRSHGYTAGFVHQTPYFLPEAFFQKYPHLRGPRVDHPRRSRREAFALCVDHPESLQMYADMSAQMARDIPDLTYLRLVANDAGSGLCWSDWLYPGPNGPRRCKHIPTAQRVVNYAHAIRSGFGNDKPLDITCVGNFSELELRDMATHQSEHLHFPHPSAGLANSIRITSLVEYPVRGMFDPVAILKSLQRLRDPAVTRIHFGFVIPDHRGQELGAIQDIIIGFVDSFLAAPAYGSLDQLKFLREACARWVGENKKDDLLEALLAMHEAFILKRAVAAVFTSHFVGTTMRAINRPLVIMPELLTPEEEAYFLPYVFNPNINEARSDYLDWHGGKLRGGELSVEFVNKNPRVASVDRFSNSLNSIAQTLATMGGTPAGDLFVRMAASLRMHACSIRSVNNLFTMGTLRDRNLDKLSAPPHIPPKLGDWTGDPDLQLMNATMRDELDNTAELITLIENGGADQLLLADKPEDEDTFLFGPNFLDTLKQKQQIMMRHWTDAQSHMSTPHK
jgi:hypothetical protein